MRVRWPGMLIGFPLSLCFLCVLGAFVASSEPLRGVRDAADWRQRRAHILAGMQQVMGPLPDESQKVPLDVKVSEEVQTPRYVRKKLTFAVEKDDRVPAYLLIPKGAAGKLPAVLCLHQTTAIGKGEPAGLGGKPNLHYAVHLAERGYVTLAPDYPSFGDYRYDFAKSRFQSGSMKAVWNNMRAIDLLASLPEVDAERIGCIGHSLGGHNTMFTAAFDPRIKALVSNCGFTSFPKYYGGNLKGWTSARYMPLIASKYGMKPEKMPFDFPEVVAAFAPRAFLASAPVEDSNFEVSGVKDCIAAARPVYELLRAGDRLAANYPSCKHDFPPEARKVAYAWLDRWLKAPALPAAQAQESRQEGLRRNLTVAETAGIRRFGYPVRVVLPAGASLSDAEHFRLLEKGKPVAAQFRLVEDGNARSVYLDFNVNHLPLEKRTYVIEYNPSTKTAGPKGSMKIEAGEDVVRVVQSAALEFEVPRSLAGLLRQVRAGKTEYLRPESPGLFIHGKDNGRSRVGDRGTGGGPPKVRVLRQGPLASALRFESTEALRDGGRVASVVEMEFPRTKSWVRVSWTVDDPERRVTGLGAELNLNVQGQPTLVDFGAGTYVYAPLRPGQRTVMRAGSLVKGARPKAPAWVTLLGRKGALQPYVVAPPGERGAPAEGWAHVMDRQRCTAVAVRGFAAEGQEAELSVDADGRLRIGRTFARGDVPVPAGPKRLTFWLHFVPMPVHVGAATSPQAMLAPLRVEVRPEAGRR